jgi:Mlc titration factor MtfA (ptsG expression regulator)
MSLRDIIATYPLVAAVVPADRVEHHEALTERLLDEQRWEAANGFALTDTMRVLIAAHGALLVLELDLDWYRAVGSIIVHPTTMVLRGPRGGPVPGVMTDAPTPILGQAQHGRGPVVVAWDAARRDAAHPERGQNVVLHELAHKLDLLDGVLDGTPPQSDPVLLDRWVQVCTAEFERVRAGGPSVLRDYAGTNPGEFFAVATEVFFCRPHALSALHPGLYGVLRDFYRQDPAALPPTA